MGDTTLLELTAKLIWKQERSFQQSESLKKAYREGKVKTVFAVGHVVNEEWIEAGKKANLGHKRHTTSHSQSTKQQISKSRKGKTCKENNPNWKGGITLQNKIDRGRFAVEIRPLVFQRDDYTCQVCSTKGKFMHVDHVKSWADFEELRFDINNCRTLCRECHYKITFGKEMPMESTWGIDCKIPSNLGEK